MFEDIISNSDKPFRARGRDPGLLTQHLFHFFGTGLYTSMDDSKYVRPTSFTFPSTHSHLARLNRDSSRCTEVCSPASQPKNPPGPPSTAKRSNTPRSGTQTHHGPLSQNKKGTRPSTRACFIERGGRLRVRRILRGVRCGTLGKRLIGGLGGECF